MEIIYERHRVPAIMQGTLDQDNSPERRGQYMYSRGAQELYDAIGVKFDLFDHLAGMMRGSSAQQVNVLESGCGYGNLLRDLKRGFAFDATLHLHLPDYYSSGVASWKRSISGRNYLGFQDRIRTTGVTLSMQHTEHMTTIPEEYRPEQVIIGAIQEHDFKGEKFDVLIDFYGAATWHPSRELFELYANLLCQDGIGLLILGKKQGNIENSLDGLDRLGLSIIDYQVWGNTTLMVKTSN